MEEEKITPTGLPEIKSDLMPGVPSARQQSWGVLISITVIVLMIVVGAFYSWGKRIAEEQQMIAPQAQ